MKPFLKNVTPDNKSVVIFSQGKLISLSFFYSQLRKIKVTKSFHGTDSSVDLSLPIAKFAYLSYRLPLSADHGKKLPSYN